ncbi:transcriptional regulator [Flavivirga aquatica]|uniref:Transcriptional regulator n=1 Tax=Flavivirga aquatica TaxID=1849968 RepID=A0A1E5TDR4_9FLAO|nr:response regulator [Flavivirga aquatica]OEK09508.1 transcriptional regulator [Flavivirga aquatica]
MFKKVLIVDDHDDINNGVLNILNTFNIETIQNAQYCDDAHLKVKKAVFDGQNFDLLITDLSFKKDHRECKISSGEELIATLKIEYPELPIIVYSMNSLLQKVRTLINKHHINAYVCKDRKGSLELSQAIEAVYNKKLFLSPQVKNALSSKSDSEIDDYDIELIKQLSLGLSQTEISKHFEQHHITPSSLSSVEKRLNKLKDLFKANNAIHLVSIIKDLGLL